MLTAPTEQAPEQGEAFDQIAKDFNQLILPGITHWQHGQFFAYFPSISTFESMIAELYSASVSNPGFNVSCPCPDSTDDLLTLSSGYARQHVRSSSKSCSTGWQDCSGCQRYSIATLDWGEASFRCDAGRLMYLHGSHARALRLRPPSLAPSPHGKGHCRS